MDKSRHIIFMLLVYCCSTTRFFRAVACMAFYLLDCLFPQHNIEVTSSCRHEACDIVGGEGEREVGGRYIASPDP